MDMNNIYKILLEREKRKKLSRQRNSTKKSLIIREAWLIQNGSKR